MTVTQDDTALSSPPGRPKAKSAPSGLTPAAPGLPAQTGTGGRAVASGIGTSSEPRAAGSVGALIFDMDGTMVDSMPAHKQSWFEFARRHGIPAEDIPTLMRRTTGRTGIECMRMLFERDMSDDEAMVFVHEKEEIYRAMFGPVFREVRGFGRFARAAHAHGLRYGVGTAGDRHNVAFVMSHLLLDPPPVAIVGGDEGLPGKPEPAIFLEVARRMGVEPQHCIVFEDAPLGIEAAQRAGMRAVGIASSHAAHELGGDHVLAVVPDFEELLKLNFLETHHVAASR